MHILTTHAKIRMQQRALRPNEMELLLATASQVSQDAYLLTDQDVRRGITVRKKEIQMLERLKGYKVALDGGVVLSFYKSGRNDQKKTLRRGRTNQ
jgi:hypothetical protein